MELSQEELEHFQAYLKKAGMAQNTISAYQSAVRQYFQLYPQLSINCLQAYKTYLLGRYQAATVNVKIHGLNRYLQYQNALPEASLPFSEKYRLPSVKHQQRIPSLTIGSAQGSFPIGSPILTLSSRLLPSPALLICCLLLSFGNYRL